MKEDKFSVYKILGIAIPFIAICVGFYSDTQKDIGIIKAELKFYKELYEREKEVEDMEDIKLEKRLDKLDEKIDKLK